MKGWVVKKSHYNGYDTKVKLTLDKRHTKFCCPDCGTKLWKKEIREITVKDLPLALAPVDLKIDVFVGVCPKCKKSHTLRPAEVHESCGLTNRFLRVISWFSRYVPAEAIAAYFYLSESAVRRYDNIYLEENLPKVSWANRSCILIDEKYLGRSLGYVTVVIDGKTSEPLFMGTGKSFDTLAPLFESLSEEEKQAIKTVGIDRGNAFLKAAQKFLPHADVCFDPFHLVSNVNAAVDEVRREETRKAEKEGKSIIKGSRYNLLSAPEKLTPDNTERLKELLRLNDSIHMAYLLKEQFRAIFQQEIPSLAEAMLEEWFEVVKQSNLAPFLKLAEGLKKSLPYILNHFKHEINNGRIESLNASISRVQARTCGIRKTGYLFLKLRQLFLLKTVSPLSQI